ncbi:MAG: winged helix-turn-helix domain-containing protein [Pyrinomonadaceae bacterium]
MNFFSIISPIYLRAGMINGDSNLREFGRFRLDAKKRVLWYEDQPVNLPLKDIELLCVLTEHSGQVITKDEILDRVWADSFVEESNLSRHIYLLRKTLKEYGESEDLIQTVPRRGYRFTGQVRESVNTDVVIEKHTSTRTLIEVQDDTAEPPPLLPVRAFTTRRVAALLGVGAVMLAAVAFLWNYLSVPGSSGSVIRSIAVLPVRSFSGSSDDEELRMRITDALITRLGNMDGIAVRPTSAVVPFAGSEQDGLEIGKKLQVDAILESRIQQEGDRLRLTMQIVRVANGEHLWSEQFDGQADRILNLQDMISSKVSRSLNAAISDKTTFARRPTENADAYEAYLKGRYFWNRRDETSMRRAIKYFNQAAALDPLFSEAYTGLADTQHLLFNYNIDVRPQIVAEAKENLRRALELKPDSADALTTLGTIQMGYDWDWPAAEESLKLAIAAAPNSSTARMRYGALLVRLRRFDKSQAEFERAIELDPLSLIGNTNLGMVYFCMKDYTAADRQYSKAMELDDKVGATHWLLSRSLWQQGRQDEAIGEIIRGLELDGNTPLAATLREKAHRSLPTDVIDLLLHEWRMNPPGTNPHNLAYLSTYIGDSGKAIYWLEKSIEEHHPWTTWVSAAPEFDILRSEQSFQNILEKLHLP